MSPVSYSGDFVFASEGKALISSDFVAAALRKSKVIKGMRIKSRFPETFLLEQAKPGSYTVVSPLLNLPVDVVICHYEQYHAGHRCAVTFSFFSLIMYCSI